MVVQTVTPNVTTVKTISLISNKKDTAAQYRFMNDAMRNNLIFIGYGQNYFAYSSNYAGAVCHICHSAQACCAEDISTAERLQAQYPATCTKQRATLQSETHYDYHK